MSENTLYILPDLVSGCAATQPNATALVDAGLTLTYAELNARADKAAAAFQQAGIKPTSSIALCGENSAAYVVLFIGALVL